MNEPNDQKGSTYRAREIDEPVSELVSQEVRPRIASSTYRDRVRVPPVVPSETTYVDRVRHFVRAIDPRTVLVFGEKARQIRERLNELETVGITCKKAKRRLLGVFHPQTGEEIFPLFRMAAYVPVNIPIVFGMLNASSMATTMFWQWVNQSYNVAVNYANRNISSPISTRDLMTSYCIAVGSSCGIAAGLRQTLKREASWPRLVRTGVKLFLPFTAVASAGALNVFFMRRQEMVKGIDVTDESGTKLATSRIAGQMALSQVMLSRIVLPLPVLALPPLIMRGLQRLWPSLHQRPRANRWLELGVITMCLAGALPASIGLFPQRGRVRADRLEPNLVDSKIHPFVYYNKGL